MKKYAVKVYGTKTVNVEAVDAASAAKIAENFCDFKNLIIGKIRERTV